jgi:hypothetical protein
MTLVIVTLMLVLLALAVGFVLLLLGAVAAIFKLVEAMPWLLILLGAWVLLLARRSGRRDARAGPVARAERRPAAGPALPQPAQPPESASAPAAGSRRELPIDVQVKVDQIRRKADLLQGYADRFPPFSYDLHLVQQTAAEYLPRTVEAYLALPGEDDPLVGPVGQIALQELKAQLSLLDAKLDEIAQNLQQQDLDRLLANRRFLEERFRRDENGFQVQGTGLQEDQAGFQLPGSRLQEDGQVSEVAGATARLPRPPGT